MDAAKPMDETVVTLATLALWPVTLSATAAAREGRGSDGDRDFAADLAALQPPHGVGRLVEREGAVDARGRSARRSRRTEGFPPMSRTRS